MNNEPARKLAEREKPDRDRLIRLAWFPIPIFLVAISAFWASGLHGSHESPGLLILCNLLFSTFASFAIAFLLGRSFLAKPLPGTLLLGCGILVWGIGSLAATIVGHGNTNITITLHNLSVWLAACFQLAGVSISRRPLPKTSTAGIWVGAAGAIALGLVWLIAQASVSGRLPVFFIQGEGGTLARQYTLVSAISLLILTTGLLRPAKGSPSSPFVAWYAGGLLLLAIGLFGVMIQSVGGSLLGWTARAAQYLGGIYLIAAAFATTRSTGAHAILPEKDLGRIRQRYLTAVVIVITSVALRLVFLQDLGSNEPYATFYPAVIFAALYGGLRSGILASLLSALMAGYYFIEPEGFGIEKTADWLALAVFLLSCSMVSWIIGAMLRARARAHEAETQARIAVELERAAEVLRESEERFRTLAAATFEGIAITESGCFTDVNDQFARMLGYEPAELIGREVSALLLPEDRERVVDGIRTGVETHIEHPVMRKDGTLITVEAHGHTTSYRDRSVRITAVRDITERKRTEERLQRERDLLQTVMNGAMNSHLVYLDRDFNFVRINDTYARNCGYRPEEMIGRNHFDLYPHAENEALFARVRDTGETCEVRDKPFEFPDQPERGVTYWDWTLIPVKETDGQVTGLVFSLFETTERKRAEERIRRQNAILNGINRVFHAALTVGSDEALGVACLAVAEEITGSRFGFIGEIGPDGLLHDIAISNMGWEACAAVTRDGERRSPSDFHIRGLYGRVILQGKGFFTNDPATHPDSIGIPEGHPPLTAFLGVPLLQDGRTIGMIAVGNRDGGYRREEQEALEALAPAVVEAFMRKRAETKIVRLNRELQHRVVELQTIFDTVPIGMAITDDLGGTVQANRTFEVIWGEPRPEPRAVSDYQLFKAWWVSSSAPVLPEEWASARAVRQGETMIGQVMKIERFDGSSAFIHNSAAPMRDESGRVIGSVVAIMDITERMEAEEALLQAQNELEKKVAERTAELVRTVDALHTEIAERRKIEQQLLQSQKMESIGILAGGVAHDFNNLLSGIHGYTEIIQENIPGDDELLRESVEHVLKASTRAAELTRSLLAFSRKQVLDPRPVLIDDIIATTGKFIKRVIGEDIEFGTEVLDRDLLIMADAGQMEQVLMNLATNARDAMPGGGRLSISLRKVAVQEGNESVYDLPSAGEYALISVSDTGIGIGKESLDRIFEPFYTTKELGKGTGLGLSIVYGIVKQHNGSVLVSSQPGKGTTFEIYLPLIAGSAEMNEVQQPTPLTAGTETLLVVEDEEIVRNLMKRILERAGYRVLIASDGEEALARFRENNDISLVLSDLVMPGKTGIEILEEIRSLKPDMKVIFISGYTRDIIHIKGVREDKIDLITKPILNKELLQKIREALDRK
jgi:PAS domain S-box-containing protein